MTESEVSQFNYSFSFVSLCNDVPGSVIKTPWRPSSKSYSEVILGSRLFMSFPTKFQCDSFSRNDDHLNGTTVKQLLITPPTNIPTYLHTTKGIKKTLCKRLSAMSTITGATTSLAFATFGRHQYSDTNLKCVMRQDSRLAPALFFVLPVGHDG